MTCPNCKSENFRVIYFPGIQGPGFQGPPPRIDRYSCCECGVRFDDVADREEIGLFSSTFLPLYSASFTPTMFLIGRSSGTISPLYSPNLPRSVVSNSSLSMPEKSIVPLSIRSKSEDILSYWNIHV